MAIQISRSLRRVSALAAVGAAVLLSGCVVAPVDPYYGTPVAAPVYSTPSYGYPAYYGAPYVAAPALSLGLYGNFGGGWRGGHRGGYRGGHGGGWNHGGWGHGGRR